MTSDEPLTIAGRVEGSISVNGHPLTITQDGNVSADAAADTILIEGTAKGKLNATTRLALRATANVTGEIFAPILSVAEGAVVHARIDTGSRKGASSRSVLKAAEVPPGKTA
jgi:cytoskeletal protein CcmA (bactofilin family)